MGIDTVSRSGGRRRFLPLLAGTALVLAGCGSDADTGPAATTAPATSSVTSTTTSTSAPSPSTTAPTSSTEATSPTATPGATTAVEAIGAWLRTEGYAYSGDCADAKLETDGGTWCSTLSRDRGEEQTYRVGRVFSQYSYVLELEKSGTTWSVVDVDEIAAGP